MDGQNDQELSSPIFEQDLEHEVRLPWPTICKLAVKACCLGMSLNDVCVTAIADAVERHRLAR